MFQELNNREANGISVSLYWDDAFYRTMIRIVDARTATDETFQVPAFAAADAFDHPFCYLHRPQLGHTQMVTTELSGEGSDQ